MIVYKAKKQQFVNDVINNCIADKVDEAFYVHLGRHTSENEVRSWQNSMLYMNNVINDSTIPDEADISIEYQIPLTSKRIDFLISGIDDDDKENVVIIELKQWDTAAITNKSAVVRTRFQHGEHEVAHPSYQAWSYAETIYNFNQTVQDNDIILSPCAYLHNFAEETKGKEVIKNDFYKEYIDKAPAFLKNETLLLKNFVEKRIKKASDENILEKIEYGKLRPAKQLADSLCSMLKGNKEFVLLDSQLVVYQTTLYLADLINNNPNKKQVLIVEGGPGTGKSVLAINLLVDLINKGFVTKYVSKNSAPRAVYTVKLTGSYKKTYINNLFVGSGCFYDVDKDTFDVLLVDEAHRLNEKSGIYSHLGENQIKEIINASKLSVFFVDDRQKIHIKDIGSKNEIENIASELNAKVYCMKLESQFRCNGSDGYLSWLDNSLQIQETANVFLPIDSYDFRVFDNPTEMFDLIKQKNETNNKSRVVAGYCWPWISKKDKSLFDIEIKPFGFKKRWNLSDSRTPWILGDDSIEEIGCIHTCQGLELDYVGVIIGDDIRYENNKIVTDVLKRANTDKSVSGFKTYLKNNKTQALIDADQIIKNTYRTLMTRGMKGCYIYCVDKALNEYFKQLIANSEQVKQLYDNSGGVVTLDSTIEEETPRLEIDVNTDVQFVDFLPVYSIKAACGYFGEGEIVENTGWMKVEGLGRKLNRFMFIVRAKGHSMEPKIHDGDYCVFQANPGGTRQDKIVLVQHVNYYDAEYSGAYSIKKYSSKKLYDMSGNWSHESIELIPLNKDYNAIIIDESEAESFKVVGEFIGVVK